MPKLAICYDPIVDPIERGIWNNSIGRKKKHIPPEWPMVATTSRITTLDVLEGMEGGNA